MVDWELATKSAILSLIVERSTGPLNIFARALELARRIDAASTNAEFRELDAEVTAEKEGEGKPT